MFCLVHAILVRRYSCARHLVHAHFSCARRLVHAILVRRYSCARNNSFYIKHSICGMWYMLHVVQHYYGMH